MCVLEKQGIISASGTPFTVLSEISLKTTEGTEGRWIGVVCQEVVNFKSNSKSDVTLWASANHL